ncbi:MAG: glucose 1-dehydrogenase [Vicinamibacterales bacterium]|nr:glucose 1-dehydrogenase [Vicinamibacterales bacterium]
MSERRCGANSPEIERDAAAWHVLLQCDMNRLKGKVAIVTGGSLGIGRACAIRMAEEGAAVAVFDVLGTAGEAVVAELCGRGFPARYWSVDVSKESEMRIAIDAVNAHFGHLDILVNNAGIAGPSKPTHEITEAEWDRVQAINVKGVFFGVKHAVPHMKHAGGGSIINLSSIYGIVGAPDVPPYHASKGAVRLMAKTDALIYAPDRIRVNSIHPGFIWTPMVEGYLKPSGDMAAARRAVDALHPLGHMGDPDDIAMGVVYLASDEAKFVTGAELVIDGGYTAR